MAGTTWSTSDKTAGVTLSGGNLTAALAGANQGVRTADRQLTGLFYFEVTCTTWAGLQSLVGVANAVTAINTAASTPTNACGVSSNAGGTIFVNGATSGATLGTRANGDVIGIAVDCTSRQIWFRVAPSGNWNGNASYAPGGSGGISLVFVGGNGIPLYPYVGSVNNPTAFTANFGDTAFTGAVPSGYTSGFTAGASVPTNALASQALAEHWLTTDPDARTTIVVAEHWASTTSTGLQAVATFVVLEHWTSVASVSPASGGPQVTMIH